MKIKQFNEKISFENLMFMFCVGISFCLLCFSLWNCFFDSVISDEVFTLYIIDGSYLDIIINTIQDVHPPLYYFITKFVLDIFTFIFPNINVVILAKVVGFSGLAILFYFAVFKLSKKLPKIVVGLSLVLVFCFGAFSEYAITARMYSYAMLFVTMCFYYSSEIIKHQRVKDFRKFVLFFVLSALTHYFALMAAAGLLVFLLVYAFVCERKEFLTFYKYALYSVLCYVPWLVVLCCQFAYLSGYGYWIPTISTNTVSAIIQYVISIKLVGFLDSIWIAVVLICVYLVTLIVNLLSIKVDGHEKWVMSSGLFAMFFVVGLGLFVSVVLTPIFVERYTLPTMFIFYLCLVYNFYLLCKYVLKEPIENLFKKFKLNGMECAKVFGKTLSVSVLCLMTVYAVFNQIKVVKHEKYINKNYQTMTSFFAEISNDTVIADHGAVQHPIEYQTGHFVYGVLGYDGSWWQNITGVEHPKLSVEQIKTKLADGENVYLAERNGDIISHFEREGIILEHQTTFVIEQQWYSVYEIDVFKLKIN